MTTTSVQRGVVAPAAPAPFVPFDPSFGVSGVLSTFGGPLGIRSAPVVVVDGRILLTAFNTAGEHVIAAFLPDGSPDLAFGPGGTGVVPMGTPRAEPNLDRIAVQADGRILIGGVLGSGATSAISVARVSASGRVDPSFSGDGRLTVSFTGVTHFLVLAGILTDGVGRILVIASDGERLRLARFASNGELDRSFGTEGKLDVTLPGTDAEVVAAALDGDGRIVVAGHTSRPDSGSDVLVARFAADGDADPTFGFAGSSLVDLGRGRDRISRMVIDADGRIVVAGAGALNGDEDEPAVVRLLPNGDRDPGFGVDGVVRLNTGKRLGRHRLGGLEVLADGRIALAGTFTLTGEDSDADPDYRVPQPFVAVLTPFGEPARSFDGADGIVFLPRQFVSNNVRLAAVADDKLLVFAGDRLIRLRSATEFASLSLRIAPSANPAPPGPLTFTVTVRNLARKPAGGVLRLRSSKPVAIVDSSGVTATVDPNRIDVIGKLTAIPRGGSAVLRLRTTVNGFEEGITLSGSVDSGGPDVNPADNSAVAFVDVVRGEVI